MALGQCVCHASLLLVCSPASFKCRYTSHPKQDGHEPPVRLEPCWLCAVSLCDTELGRFRSVQAAMDERLASVGANVNAVDERLHMVGNNVEDIRDSTQNISSRVSGLRGPSKVFT